MLCLEGEKVYLKVLTAVGTDDYMLDKSQSRRTVLPSENGKLKSALVLPGQNTVYIKNGIMNALSGK